MKIQYLLWMAMTVYLLSSSCKSNNPSAKNDQSPSCLDEVSIEVNDNGNSIMESLKITGNPIKLCELKITSDEYMEKLQPPEGFEPFMSYEATPVSDAFFYPEQDIMVTDMVKNIQNRFNYVTVGNIVSHAEQLYYRKFSESYGECDSVVNSKEKLRLVAEDMPKISSNILNKAFPSKKVLDKAQNLLSAYRRYSGDDDDHFWDLFSSYKKEFINLPGTLTGKQYNDSVAFAQWYDKNQFIHGYDRLNEERTNQRKMTEEELQYLVSAVECEKNLDRRTLLAMELLCHDREMGILKLGEIFESGLYSRYLYEAWDMWRTSVQSYHFGVSSFSMIPDNYYSQIKAKCVNSIIRHIQKSPKEDHKFDILVAEFLITTPCLERMGGYFGNEAVVNVF